MNKGCCRKVISAKRRKEEQTILQKKDKNKTRIWSMLLLSTVMLFMMGCQSNKIAEEDKPENLIKTYATYINEQKYEQMYNMLTETSKTTFSQNDFITRNKKIYEGIEASDVAVEVKNAAENEEKQVVVSYTMSFDTLAGKVSFDNTATFEKASEEDKYYLVWDHNMIFPNLEATDKVKVSTLEAKRGSIYDRNDVVLAETKEQLSIGLIPGQTGENYNEDIKTLADLLDLSVDTVESKLNASWVQADSLVPIATIDKSEKDDSAEAKLEQKLEEIKGVSISTVETREYPLKEKAAHLIGYLQSITAEELEAHKEEGYTSSSVIGKVGLEKAYESDLKGTNGVEISIMTSSGEQKESIAKIEKEDGKDIKLTIDATLQKSLYDEFKKDNSCSVAMNPTTGEVLALVSTPSYDTNKFIAGISSSDWTKLSEDENKPLTSRFQSKWCPGSSFKPITAAVGVSTGKVDPTEDFGKEGLTWQKDSSWGEYYISTLHEYNDVVLKNALIYSDNIYFAKAALKIGADTFAEQLTNLGFGESFPFDLSLSASQFSNGDTFSTEVQLADSGYGQAQVLLNPVHLATIYTAFSNEGSIVTPYLQYKENPTATFWKENVFTKDAVKDVKEALIQVIENAHGTAYAGKIDGLSLAGKTGTAEIKASKDDTEGTELGWFAVFTADEKEENPVLLVSMVEDVKDRGGSAYVVKKDKKILEKLYKE